MHSTQNADLPQRVLVEIPSQTGQALVTLAIGEPYLENWRTYARPSWLAYCRRHGLGLYVIIDFISESGHPARKTAYWEKFLLLDLIAQIDAGVRDICYLDTDILISPIAPNIFSAVKNIKNLAVVSSESNLPYPLDIVKRRIAFLRHHFYSEKYPLDSILFATPEQLAKLHGAPAELFSNFFTSGLFVANISNHRELLKKGFYKYANTVYSADATEQFHFNYEFFSYGNVEYLPYQFQALWVYEMAWKYPFLYDQSNVTPQLIKDCIEASLYENYFLHFAGSWYESAMWKQVHAFEDNDKLNLITDFEKYCLTPVTGNPVGIIKP